MAFTLERRQGVLQLRLFFYVEWFGCFVFNVFLSCSVSVARFFLGGGMEIVILGVVGWGELYGLCKYAEMGGG